MVSLTDDLAERIGALASEPLPSDVQHEATRSLLNVVGTALRASHSAAARILTAATVDTPGTAVILGRPERRAPRAAAMINGTSAHFDDYDDTHLATVIHPGATSMAAALATRPKSGSALLRAFALGVEVQLRVGLAMTPSHYDRGWHITGTCGSIGAAVTGGVALGESPATLAEAIALAATATAGHRESFGTMLKPVQVGLAAAHGVEAALLAAQGHRLDTEALDGKGRFFEALSSQWSTDETVTTLGRDWHLLNNTYKPYPCGIVTHPALDAAIAIHERGDLPRPTAIREVRLTCHPLVPELTGQRAPRTGLEARFSTVHGVAMALLTGRAGPEQYDTLVNDPEIIRLRDLVQMHADPNCARDSATLIVEYSDGRSAEHHVAHARGSLSRPLTDAELRHKFLTGAEPILGNAAEELADNLLNLELVEDVDDLVRLAVPSRTLDVLKLASATGDSGRSDATPAPGSPIEWLVGLASASDLPRAGQALQAADAILHTVARIDRGTPGAGRLDGVTVDGEQMSARDRAFMIAERAFIPGASVVERYACVVGSAVLSVAEDVDVPRWRILEAVSFGMTACTTLAVYLGHDTKPSPWDSVGTVAGIGATIAVTRLARQDADAARRSLAVAAVQAGGLAGVNNLSAQRLINARTAAIGVESARLGASGVTGPFDPIDGRRGMFALMNVQDGGRFDPDAGASAWVDEILASTPFADRSRTSRAAANEPDPCDYDLIASAANWTGIAVSAERFGSLARDVAVHHSQVEQLFDVRLGDAR
jgi:2-methylcitrate dehydratase PrpD